MREVWLVILSTFAALRVNSAKDRGVRPARSFAALRMTSLLSKYLEKGRVVQKEIGMDEDVFPIGLAALTNRQRHRHGHGVSDRRGNHYCRGVGSRGHAGDISSEREGRSLSGSVAASGWGDCQPCL